MDQGFGGHLGSKQKVLNWLVKWLIGQVDTHLTYGQVDLNLSIDCFVSLPFTSLGNLLELFKMYTRLALSISPPILSLSLFLSLIHNLSITISPPLSHSFLLLSLALSPISLSLSLSPLPVVSPSPSRSLYCRTWLEVRGLMPEPPACCHQPSPQHPLVRWKFKPSWPSPYLDQRNRCGMVDLSHCSSNCEPHSNNRDLFFTRRFLCNSMTIVHLLVFIQCVYIYIQ